MNKKHFIALAEALREVKPREDDPFAYGQWQRDVAAICGVCRSQNCNFNESVFLGFINGTKGPNGGKR